MDSSRTFLREEAVYSSLAAGAYRNEDYTSRYDIIVSKEARKQRESVQLHSYF